MRYIRQEGRPFYERFMWFCFTLTGAVSTLIIIASVWNKFQTNPTITGLDTDFHNSDIMFPSVWLCPQDSFNESQADGYIKTLIPSENDELVKYKILARVMANLSFYNLQDLQVVLPDVSAQRKQLQRLSKEAVYRCQDVLIDCKFANLPFDCCSEFQRVFTEVGSCYAFNSRQVFYRNKSNAGLLFSPKTILATDESWSLKFNMKKLQKGEDLTNVPVKVYILQADEMPVIDIFPQLVWDRSVTKLSFSYKETYTTEDTRQLSISQRQCVYRDEVKLDIDTIYTYTACRSQCRMARARELCGCVPFFCPKSSKFKKCDLEGLKCLGQQSERTWRQLVCKCQLGCSNTVYEVAKLVDVSGSSSPEAVYLEVGFLSWPMLRYKREVLFGWVDLLVSFGGIAGLFLGFSLLSGIEIIYYFTLRAFCMAYRDAEHLLQLRAGYEEATRPPLDLSLTPSFCRNKVKPTVVRPAFQQNYLP